MSTNSNDEISVHKIDMTEKQTTKENPDGFDGTETWATSETPQNFGIDASMRTKQNK